VEDSSPDPELPDLVSSSGVETESAPGTENLELETASAPGTESMEVDTGSVPNVGTLSNKRRR